MRDQPCWKLRPRVERSTDSTTRWACYMLNVSHYIYYPQLHPVAKVIQTRKIGQVDAVGFLEFNEFSSKRSNKSCFQLWINLQTTENSLEQHLPVHLRNINVLFRRRHAAIESHYHRLSTGFMAVAIAVSHTTMEIIIYGTVLVVGPTTLADVKIILFPRSSVRTK
jgi:hypothetical protein